MKPLADDLAGFGPGLLFPRQDGKPWREHDLKNWRNRVWQPAIAAMGLGSLTVSGQGVKRRQRYEGPPPYELRHSFASLLLGAHENPIVVAAECGNSPKVLLDTYAHIIHELRDQPGVKPEQQIALARRQRAILAHDQPADRAVA